MSKSDGRRARRRPGRPDASEETAVWLAELEQLAEHDHRAADEEEWARTLRSKHSREPGSTGEYQTGEYQTGEYQTGEYRMQPPPMAPPAPEYPSAHHPEYGYPAEPRQDWPSAPPPAATGQFPAAAPTPPPPPAADPGPGWLNPPLSPLPPRPATGYGSPVSDAPTNSRWDEWDHRPPPPSNGDLYQEPPSPWTLEQERGPWEVGHSRVPYGDPGPAPGAAQPPAPEPWQPSYQDPSWSQPPSTTGQFPAPAAAPRQPEPWEVPSEPEPWTAAWPAPEPQPQEQLPPWPDDGLTADTGTWQPDPGRWTDQPWNAAPPSPAAPAPAPFLPAQAAPPPVPPSPPAYPSPSLDDSLPTQPVARLQPPPFAAPPVARRNGLRAGAGPDEEEQVIALSGQDQMPQRATRPSWGRNGASAAFSAENREADEDLAFGGYAGKTAGGRPAWPRVIALISWIVLLMVLCWFYVFPWLEHVLPANF